jgi:hypothetical protein
MTHPAQKPDALIAGAGIQGAIALQHQLRMLNEVMIVALNAAHAIAGRQSAAVSELNQHMALLARAGMPLTMGDSVTASLTFAKQAFDASAAHSIAITEIVAKMGTGTLTILSNSVSAGLDGLQRHAAKMSHANG